MLPLVPAGSLPAFTFLKVLRNMLGIRARKTIATFFFILHFVQVQITKSIKPLGILRFRTQTSVIVSFYFPSLHSPTHITPKYSTTILIVFKLLCLLVLIKLRTDHSAADYFALLLSSSGSLKIHLFLLKRSFNFILQITKILVQTLYPKGGFFIL